MAKSHPFTIWSGLITTKHRDQLGSAIWLYLWCIARVTKEADGWGLVLGGKPITYNDIEQDLGLRTKMSYRYLVSMTKMSYLKTTRTPCGLVIYVNKSKKFKARTGQKCPIPQNEQDKNVQSNIDSKDSKDSKDIREWVSSYPFIKDKTFLSYWEGWLEVRKKLKAPSTDQALKIALDKLHRHNLKTATAMLEQSIERGWRGIFPLKTDLPPDPKPHEHRKDNDEQYKKMMAGLEKEKKKRLEELTKLKGGEE